MALTSAKCSGAYQTMPTIETESDCLSMGAPAVMADVVEDECCHGKGRPPVWPELIGTDGAPDVPATREAA